MCLVNLAINSNRTLLRNCHQNNGLLRMTKQSPQPPPVPNIQIWGVFCFLLIAQAAAQLCMEQMGEGTLHFFFCLKAAEPQKKPYWFFLPIAQLLFSQVLRSNDHQQNKQIKPDFQNPHWQEVKELTRTWLTVKESLWIDASSVQCPFTDTCLTWTPHYYGQFALSLGKVSPNMC